MGYELYSIQTIHDAWMYGAMTTADLVELYPAIEEQLNRAESFVDDLGLIFCGPGQTMEAMEFNYYDVSDSLHRPI